MRDVSLKLDQTFEVVLMRILYRAEESPVFYVQYVSQHRCSPL